MKETQYQNPETEGCPTSWTSVWTSSRGFLARNSVDLKGFACILPVRQGSQTGSGAVFEVISIPVTKWWSSSFLTPLWWWWANRQCHKAISKGRVDIKPANSFEGTVWPSRHAELLSLMVAVKSAVSFLMKDMVWEFIWILK